MPSRVKRNASLSLDLDNKWSYMKVHGDSNWRSFPGYLNIVVPRVLDILNKRSLKITFFIVGQDAALPSNWSALQSIVAEGHEVANHSFHHEPWLHLYSEPQIDAELNEAEAAIRAACGVTVKGFRGPGFSISDGVRTVLAARGYRYDASTFPNIIGPVARAYYLASTKLTQEERSKRGKLFGSFRDGLLPLRIHNWQGSTGSFIEVPVTTIPCLRLPFHLSYLMYLSRFSTTLSRLYLSLGLALCRYRNVEPSFLLHPLDFLGPDEAPELSFFPAMQVSLSHKLTVANMALDILAQHYTLCTVGDHAASAAGSESASLGSDSQTSDCLLH